MPELTWDQIEAAPAEAAASSSLTWDQVESVPPTPVGKPSPKRPMTQEESNAAGIRGLKKFGKDVLDVADMVLSAPAFIGSMAVRGATYVGGALQGRTHKDISSAAKMGGEFFMGDAQKMYLANPIKQLFGAKTLDETLGEGHIARAMGAMQKYVDKGGQYVEHRTNGTVNADDVGFITDVVSTVAGGAAARGTVKGAQKLAAYLRKNKPLPDADMAAGKSSRATAEDIINKYNRTPEGKADPVTRQTGQDVIDGYAQADKDIKTFNIAHDLIMRGASTAEVERTIRKYKHLDIEGQMDAIMKRRAEVMQGASGDMIMTEGKKPDVGYPEPEVSPRIGTDMPPDGGGVSPDAGTPPTPGALPAPPPKKLTYNGQSVIDAERAQAAGESASRIPAKDGVPLEFDEAGRLRQVRPQPTEIPKPDALKTAVEKISAGRNFDLTAEEKVAWNKAKSINLESGKIDEGAPQLDAAVPRDRGQPRIPQGQLGGVDRGAGRDALESIVPALGPLLAQEHHTPKTLERLPQNRTEFPKRPIEEQLKRSDVAEAEKDLRQAKADLEYSTRALETWDDYARDYKREGPEADARRQEALTRVEEAQAEVTRLQGILDDPKSPKYAPEHQGIYDRHKKDVESFVKSLGGKPVRDEEGHGWYEVPVTPLREGGGRAAMFGKVDQDLLTKVGAVGLGVAAVTFLSKEDSAAGNALGAAALLGLGVLAHSKSPAVRHSAEGAAKQLNEALGLVSTTLKNADERVWLRAVDHERRVLTETHRVLEEINPFVEAVRGLPKLEGQAVDLALKNGDLRSVTAVIKALGDPKALESWDKVQTFLKESGKELKELGVIKGTLPNYFPRVVKDLEGLLDSLGAQQKKGLEKALQDAEKKSLKASGQGLDELERSQVVNAYLAGRGGEGSGKPGFTKARVIEQVTPAMAKFYASSDDALVRYANQAVKAKERARFFGKDMVKDPDTGRFNLGASIGELVEKGIAEGKLDAKKAEDIRAVLQSRFGPGERSPVSVIKGYQNLTNAALLGNVFSSMVQLGDAGMAAYAYGMMPTIQTVVQIAAGRKKAGVKDLGLVDHISQEMASGSVEPMKIAGHEVSTAKFLDKIFKVTGFSAVDQLGKTVVINTALNKASRQVASPKGVGDLYARYGEAYGPDFGKLVEGLKAGELTPEVRLYLFAELSRFQPISKLEVPKKYLDNPNGRVMYMLKTYMLKQMDLVRRDALQEVAKGNVRKGATNLTKLVITLGTAGATTEAIRNWLLGKEDEFELSDVPENFLKTMGWSQYVVDQAREGKPVQTIAGTLAPPFKVWDDILTQNKNADRYIPLIGPLLHEMNKEEK